MKIKILHTSDKNFARSFTKIKQRGGVFEKAITTSVKRIIADVRARGDVALYEYARRFGDLTAEQETLSITPQELAAAAAQVTKQELSALHLAARRIKKYHQHQKEKGYTIEENGALLGQRLLPLARVGIYAPGGLASYPSTILMAAIPALVAGVPDIVLCSPQRGATINPLLAAAAKICRINKFFRIGGAQAIAALAYGTATVPRVDKIVGPGNAYVASAKMQVYGDVDIDMVAGPSEVLIIADASASPAYIAADMLAQAEHDERASALLITTSEALAIATAEHIAIQSRALGKKNIIEKSLTSFGALIVACSLEEAIAIANDFAPEHLALMVRGAPRLLNKIKNAGSVFLGEHTPEALGDYIAGVNHILPTAGAARFASPLGVYDFTKRMSFLSFSPSAFARLATATATFANAEGLSAHARSLAVRQEEGKKKKGK